MPERSHDPFPTQLQGITDLTVVADIKPGLIDGIFESRSYAWRLRQVLALLDAARHGDREAAMLPNPFVDGVGRLRGIHFFRFGVLPGDRQLLLNVTFDGGWEPYIRLVWGPLGTMLDLIFCHCVGYPQAATSRFDDYVRWVRGHEVPGLFFYADGPGTAGDRSYLGRLEALQRAGGHRPGADQRATQLALDVPKPTQPSPGAVAIALRSLKGLFGLTRFFGMPPDGANAAVSAADGSVLLRFAQHFLPDLRAWYAQGLFDPGQRFDHLRAPFERERTWLMLPRWTRPEKKDRLAGPDPAALQTAILQSPRAKDGGVVRGALVLARVTNGGAACGWLRDAANPGGDGAPALIGDGNLVDLEGEQVACSVAITYAGLRALGVREERLAELPAEFRQGMEARAGLLGDLRGNHPQQWKRPRAGQTGPGSGTGPAPLDLGVVHLVIQLRTAEVGSENQGPAADRSALLPRLQQWLKRHVPTAAVEVLAIEPAWSRPAAAGEAAPRSHFGYVDGASQPTLTPSANSQFWDDSVKAGELLLGWVNDRGDGPLDVPGGKPAPVTPVWLDNSTFLVVRKIRQFVARLDAIVERCAASLAADGLPLSPAAARELVRAKLMGRGSDGAPLVAQRGAGANDFDFRHDADGAHCPFASHIRRANPRGSLGGDFPPPRILRRGMSYGPPADKANPQGRDHDERGLLFMAYNASIAEQFEVIQRWLTGGNSSGVSSTQPDPFLGVPQLGQPTVYRFSHGDRVVRVDLGDQPLTRLEWGLYGLVPSIELLGKLGSLDDDPADGRNGAGDTTTEARARSAGPSREAIEEAAERQQLKDEFEDDLTRASRWRRVLDRKVHPGGVEKVGRTVMVGGYDAVMKVLADDGSLFSVSGYGERMAATLGPSPFGQDDAGPHAGHQLDYVSKLKEAIAGSVTVDVAFATAHSIVRSRLEAALQEAKARGLPGATVDVVELGVALVAALCANWFGVDPAATGPIDPKATAVRCPGHFLVMARKIFSAYPNNVVETLAKLQAAQLNDGVASWVAAARVAKEPPPVMAAVLKALNNAKIDEDEQKATVANVMLGLPATLLGSWAKVLVAWIQDRRLWQLQHELARAMPAAADPAMARQVLYPQLIGTMAADPVADGIWRTVLSAGQLGSVSVAKDDIVWLGLGAALSEGPKDDQDKENLLFGGLGVAPHACPGHGLAIGALLGALAALLMAGQWAATASPSTLSLQPRLDKASGQ